MTIKDKLRQAIVSQVKINFRLKSSPQGKYILFQPYGIIIDLLFSREKLYGLLEDHHSNLQLKNSLSHHEIDQIEEVILMSDKFDPAQDWQGHVDIGQFKIVFK